ncbi:MAG TPA: hypothetical protein VLA72_01835 [Anaerolineales bacterium]|nr:hypothetical protein [Anaerolineales bacterium]
MNSISLLLLLCGSIIVTAGIAGMAYLFVTSRKSKKQTMTEAPHPERKDFKSWIIPFIIAAVVAIWNVLLAIVCLLIVWVLRLNPKKELSHIVTNKERLVCEKNYKWLRNSSIFTVPVFLIALFLDVHPAIAAFLPFLFHVRLIGRLGTENLYVYRHTQQALFLFLLRAGTAIAIFSYFYLDGFLFFVIVNGSLWLFGTNWEISQVKRNDCWLMRRRGEEILSKEIVPMEKPSLKDEIKYKTSKEKKAEVKKSLNTFRAGTREERIKAVLILAELGEVEKF